jgi:uncharacterized integral membrane protein
VKPAGGQTSRIRVASLGVADPARESQTAPTERTSWRHWALGVAVVLLAVIVVQNSQEVRVELLFGEFNAPLILVLLITAALGAVIGYVTPVLRRHRRQERRRDG